MLWFAASLLVIEQYWNLQRNNTLPRQVKNLLPGVPPVRPLLLCVEDDELYLSLRKAFLEQSGYNVIGATTAQEALSVLRESTRVRDDNRSLPPRNHRRKACERNENTEEAKKFILDEASRGDADAKELLNLLRKTST